MDLQELYDWLYNQRPDGVGIPLKGTGIVLGLLMIAAHAWAWLKAEQAMVFAKSFPRHRVWGIVLLAVALVWTLFLMAHMDMADFYSWRGRLLMGLPISAFLVVVYVPEFLAVRALGSLMLLSASLLLHAAFLQPQTSRLLLPILAYAWVIAGMFFVGTPYVLRDWITWLTDKSERWKMAALGGLAYGALVLVAAIVSY
jgi:hypothetical protein